jgi:hypothetical protein
MNLDFSNLAAAAPQAPRPSADQVKALAREAGAAEGFTDRAPAAEPVSDAKPTRVAPPGSVLRQLRPPMVQMNIKVPEGVRSAFVEEMEREAATNRAIRSAGDFLELILTEWKKERTPTSQ